MALNQSDGELQVEFRLVLLISDRAAAGAVVVFDLFALGLDVEALEAVFRVVRGHQGDLSHRQGRRRAPEIDVLG